MTTSGNEKTLTRQEIFDKAWLGLKSQGFARSTGTFRGNETCAYRGDEGRRCAIGWCISDEAYVPSLEGKGALRPAVLAAAGISGRDDLFASDLQRCHDKARNPEEVEARLRAFASERDLTTPDEPVLQPEERQ